MQCLLHSSIQNRLKEFCAWCATFRRGSVQTRKENTNDFHCYHCEIPSVCVSCVLAANGMKKKSWHQMSLTFSNSAARKKSEKSWQATIACCNSEQTRKKIVVRVRTVPRLHMFEIMEWTIEHGFMWPATPHTHTKMAYSLRRATYIVNRIPYDGGWCTDENKTARWCSDAHYNNNQ